MTAKKATQTTKKAEDGKINVPVKAAEPVKTEKVVKEPVKKEEAKAEPAKPEVKEVPKTEKKAAEKEAPKAKPKKTEPKKAEKKEVVQNVYVQFAGKEILTSELVAQVTEKWVALGHRASSIKSLNLYVKPEDQAAYYVINGKESGKIEL